MPESNKKNPRLMGSYKVTDEDFLKVAMAKASSSVWFDLDKSEQLEHFKEALKRLTIYVKKNKKEKKPRKPTTDEKQVWDWYLLGLKQKLPKSAERLQFTPSRKKVVVEALRLHPLGDLRIALRAFFRDEWVARWETKNAWDIRYAIGSFPQKGDLAEAWMVKSEKPNINSGKDGFVENVISKMPGYDNK
jgi:hypothetical protein